MHRQFINSCLACSMIYLFLRNKFFSILQLFGNLLLDLLGRAYSSIPILHTSCFYFSVPDLPLDLLDVVESFRFKFDLRNSNILTLLFPISRHNCSFSFVQFFAEPFSLLGRPSRLSVQGSSGDFLSLKECTTYSSRSLFAFDCELKIVETTDSLSTLAPVACMLARLSTNSGRCFQGLAPQDPNMV